MKVNIKSKKIIKFDKNLILKSSYSEYELIKFIKSIKEKSFLQNKSLSSAPWKYIRKKKFNFFFLTKKNKNIVGVIIIINTRFSCHLSFLYLNRNYRNIGLGKNLINFFFLITRKKILTVHIFKKDKKVLKFYKDNGFVKLSEKAILKYKALKIWKQRVIKFDSKSLIERHIFYFHKKNKNLV